VNITIKCKLLPNKEQHQQLLDVMSTFNNACDWVSEKAFENKCWNKIRLQKIVYHELRQRFNLSSQLAIRVIGKVANSYRYHRNRKSIHMFQPLGTVDYDARIFSIKKDLFSITALGGRIKIPYRSRKSLDEYNICSQCELQYDKTKNKFYMILAVEQKETAPIIVEKFIGVDMGIVNIATCSDGETISGEDVENYRKKITSHKSRLQSKGTKSAKRRLKKISKRERRYKTNLNHIVSKKIVEKAKELGVGIKLEDLSFNKKTFLKFNKKLRDNNAKLGKWAFGQLRDFITYKAKIAGVPVLFVNPAYTSQKCSRCGHTHEDNRKTQSEFVCLECGYESNADLNAAMNISRAVVNQPIVSATCSQGHTSRSLA